MATLDLLNAKEVIDDIRRDCEKELAAGVKVVIRQEWLELENGMIHIHTVHSKHLTVLTIGIPLPECPCAVADSFPEAQLILEEFYASSRIEG